MFKASRPPHLTWPWQWPDMRHGVNVAQGLKSAAVWWRFNETTTETNYTDLARRRMTTLDTYFGMATGMYGADELLIGTGVGTGTVKERKDPSRGSELCAVVRNRF